MLVPKQVEEQRLNICRSCEHFINMRRCGICGCFMDVKAKFEKQRCPIGKWVSQEDVDVRQ